MPHLGRDAFSQLTSRFMAEFHSFFDSLKEYLYIFYLAEKGHAQFNQSEKKSWMTNKGQTTTHTEATVF